MSQPVKSHRKLKDSGSDHDDMIAEHLIVAAIAIMLSLSAISLALYFLISLIDSGLFKMIGIMMKETMLP